jgi:hypothetical protein
MSELGESWYAWVSWDLLGHFAAVRGSGTSNAGKRFPCDGAERWQTGVSQRVGDPIRVQITAVLQETRDTSKDKRILQRANGDFRPGGIVAVIRALFNLINELRQEDEHLVALHK